MDEQTLNNQQVTPTATQAAAAPAAQQTTPLQSSVTAQPAENLPAGVSDYSAQIAQMYDAQMAAKQQSMEDAYNQNMTTMQRAREQIAPTYFNQGNDLATQYERTRRNNNMRADMNGLNTGAASQMDLAQQSNYLDAFGQIRTAQANAERQADQQIADLEVAYKSQVAQALADNDYQKATALLQEYQRRDNAAEEMRRYNQQQAMADAKLRAAYGDFGGYADMYGQDTANAMQKYWAMNNPDYAYAMGLISASEYQAMTGMAPGGYSSGSSSGRSSGGSYYRRSGGGGGGGGSNVPGSGVYDPNAPAEAGSTTANNGVDDATMEYVNHLKMVDAFGGNESAAYAQELRNQEMTAQAYAEQAASAYGLKPGTSAYNTFVSEQKSNILANDPTYAALRTASNATGEQNRAKELEAQSKAERQKVADFQTALQDYDPVTGMSYADLNSQAAQSKSDASRFLSGVGSAISNWWNAPLPPVPNQGDPTGRSASTQNKTTATGTTAKTTTTKSPSTVKKTTTAKKATTAKKVTATAK